MSKLIVEGNDLTVVKNVVRAMGNYKVTELISNDDKPKFEKPIIEGTCSACPYFTDLYNRPEQWGRCSKYGDAAGNRNKPFCRAYKEEIGFITVIQ